MDRAVSKTFVVVLLVILCVATATAEPGKGLRVASMGHSLVPRAVACFEKIVSAAGLTGHHQIQQVKGGAKGSPGAHWAYTGEIQVIKPLLMSGECDILTMALHYEKSEAEDIARWIDLGLEHNPEMRFFIMDAWPRIPRRENPGEEARGPLQAPDMEAFLSKQEEINRMVDERMDKLRERYPGKVFLLPVGNGMIELRRRMENGKLPGIENVVGKPENSLYADSIHPGTATAIMQGYVYFACIYQQNPQKIENPFAISDELNGILQEVAWEVVRNNKYTGVK